MNNRIELSRYGDDSDVLSRDRLDGQEVAPNPPSSYSMLDYTQLLRMFINRYSARVGCGGILSKNRFEEECTAIFDRGFDEQIFDRKSSSRHTSQSPQCCS